MKFEKKYIFSIIVFLLVLSFNNIVYGTGRFVDIPVPPNDSGKANYSEQSEENNKNENNNINQEKDNKTKSENNEDKIIKKSDNNFLKKLEIKGYKLEPEFDKNKNDYTVDIKRDNDITTIDIIAEVEDENAKIEGNGQIDVKKDQDEISINVIAENGSINVYSIKINEEINNATVKKEDNNEKKEIQNNKEEKNDMFLIIGCTVGVIIFGILGFIIYKRKK